MQVRLFGRAHWCEARAIHEAARPWLQLAMELSLVTLQARFAAARRGSRAKREPMPIVSPYVVHRHPEHRRRQWLDNKPHWTYVDPGYLSKAFAEARDGVERFQRVENARERPTFHEIRGLGARLLEAKGVPEDEIQGLMTHSNPRTTKVYLGGGAKALSDAVYHKVRTRLSVREVLR